MIKIEEDLKNQLINNSILSKVEFGVENTKLLQSIEKFGVVNAVKNQIKRGQTSETYQVLEKNNRLDLSVEAVITKGKYGNLFTDDEVNFCFELLCESGFYKI